MRTAIIWMVAALGCMGLAAGFCSEGYHECVYNGMCIPNHMVCDGSLDCPYIYDDERRCDTATTPRWPCYDGQYQCETDECIPDRWVCDGWPDCPNADDEDDCDTTDDYTTETSEEPSCSDDEYTCLSGDCISDDYVCDDYEDCPDGDDEDDCDATDSTDTTAVTICPGGYYACEYDGKCIPDSWVCDGIEDCLLYGEDELGCTESTTTATNTTTAPPHCDFENFDIIYDRCVLVDPFTTSNWDEGRYLCEMFNSDLVVLDDYNFYAELLRYIRNKGLDSHSYWVGAADTAEEGVWLWVDSSPVPSWSTFWALYGCTGDYQLEPNPSEAESQDCGFLDLDRGLYMSDASCDESFASICQAPIA